MVTRSAVVRFYLADDVGPRAAWGYHEGPGARAAALEEAAHLAKTVHKIGDRVVRVIRSHEVTEQTEIAAFSSPVSAAGRG